MSDFLRFLDSLDKAIFGALNSLHLPFMDGVMMMLTHEIYWLPLFLLVAYKIVRVHGKNSLWIFLGLAIVITVSDQVASSLMKPFFERLRPSHDPYFADSIHIVDDYRGGMYGFVSAHAANAFGSAFFLWWICRAGIRWIAIMFIWAGIFSYTRIYLGVHYPGDIFFGGLIGMGVSYGVYLLVKRLPALASRN